MSLDPPVPPADPDAPWSLRWTAADADGDPLSFMVLYSDDGGETWSVLTVWLTGSGLELAPGELAGSGCCESGGTCTAVTGSDEIDASL